jgi:hypothetical protein
MSLTVAKRCELAQAFADTLSGGCPTLVAPGVGETGWVNDENRRGPFKLDFGLSGAVALASKGVSLS